MFDVARIKPENKLYQSEERPRMLNFFYCLVIITAFSKVAKGMIAVTHCTVIHAHYIKAQ